MEKIKEFRKQLREAVANYISTKGCGCCEGSDHEKHEAELGKLLNVPKYNDGSGYDFYKYKTP